MATNPYSLHKSSLPAHAQNGTMAGCLSGLIILGALLSATPFMAWVLMLTFGALHHSVWASVPAFGYSSSLIIVFSVAVLRILVGRFSVSSN